MKATSEMGPGRLNRGVPPSKFADFVQMTSKGGTSSSGTSKKKPEILPIKIRDKNIFQGLKRPTQGVPPAKFEDFVESVRRGAASTPKTNADYFPAGVSPKLPKMTQRTPKSDVGLESGTRRPNKGIPPKKFRDFVDSPPKGALLNGILRNKSYPLPEGVAAGKVVKVSQKTLEEGEPGSRRANRGVPPKKYRDFTESTSKGALPSGNAKKKPNSAPEGFYGGSTVTGNESHVRSPACRSPSETKYRKGALLMRKRSQVRKIPAKMQASALASDDTSQTLPEPDVHSDGETDATNTTRPQLSYTELRELQDRGGAEKVCDAGAEPSEKPIRTKLTPVKFLEIVIPIAPNTKSRKIFLNDVEKSSEDSIWEKQPAIPPVNTPPKERNGASESAATAVGRAGKLPRIRESLERLVSSDGKEELRGKKRKAGPQDHSREPHQKMCKGIGPKENSSRRGVSGRAPVVEIKACDPNLSEATGPHLHDETVETAKGCKPSNTPMESTKPTSVADNLDDKRYKSPNELTTHKNESSVGVRPSRIRKPSVKLTGSALYSWWSRELAKKKSGTSSYQKLASEEDSKTEESRELSVEMAPHNAESGEVGPSRIRRPVKPMESAQYSTSCEAEEPTKFEANSSSRKFETGKNSVCRPKQEEISESPVEMAPHKTEPGLVRPSRIRRPSARRMESAQYSTSCEAEEPAKCVGSSSSRKFETGESSVCRPKQEEKCESPVELTPHETEPGEVRPSRIRRPSARLIESAQSSTCGRSSRTSKSYGSTISPQLRTDEDCKKTSEESSKQDERPPPLVEMSSTNNGPLDSGVRPSRIRKPSARLIESAQHSASYRAEGPTKSDISLLSLKLDTEESSVWRPKSEKRCKAPFEMLAPKTEPGEVGPSRIRRPSARLMESAQYSTSCEAEEPAKCDASSSSRKYETGESSVCRPKQEKCESPVEMATEPGEVRPSRTRRPSARLMESAQYSTSCEAEEPAKFEANSSYQTLETGESSVCRPKQEEKCESPVEVTPHETEPGEVRPSRIRRPSARLMAEGGAVGPTKCDASSSYQTLETGESSLFRPKQEESWESAIDKAPHNTEPGEVRPTRIRKPSARLIESAQSSTCGRSENDSSSLIKRVGAEENSASSSEQESCKYAVTTVTENILEGVRPSRTRKPTVRLIESAQYSGRLDTGRRGVLTKKRNSHRRGKNSTLNSKQAEEEQPDNVQIESEEEIPLKSPSIDGTASRTKPSENGKETATSNSPDSLTSKSSRHYRFVSSKGKRYAKCAYCPYQTRQLTTFWQHMRVHSGERPFKCDECSYKAASKHTLQVHVRIHTGERPYPCGHCDYRASCRSSLNTHVRRHTGVKPYGCGYCGYRSIQITPMRIHMRNLHHSDTEKFPFGGATALKEMAIEGREEDSAEETEQENMKTTEELPMESHGCIICDFRTSSFDGLATHMKIHL